jgi:hypothetical protein
MISYLAKRLPDVAVIRSGDVVNIDGVEDMFGGEFYVKKVAHTFTSSGYRQSFQVSRSSTGAK